MGISKGDLEAQWKKDNKWPAGADLPQPEKGILDKVYARTRGGFFSISNFQKGFRQLGGGFQEVIRGFTTFRR